MDQRLKNISKNYEDTRRKQNMFKILGLKQIYQGQKQIYQDMTTMTKNKKVKNKKIKMQ